MATFLFSASCHSHLHRPPSMSSSAPRWRAWDSVQFREADQLQRDHLTLLLIHRLWPLAHSLPLYLRLWHPHGWFQRLHGCPTQHPGLQVLSHTVQLFICFVSAICSYSHILDLASTIWDCSTFQIINSYFLVSDHKFPFSSSPVPSSHVNSFHKRIRTLTLRSRDELKGVLKLPKNICNILVGMF